MNEARFIGIGTLIEGDVDIGKGTWIGHYCILEGLNAKLTIGKGCSIANFVRIYTHDTSYRTISENHIRKEVATTKIGNYTQIGEGSIVLHGVTIGNHTIIGAGSVVTKDIPNWYLAVGHPCKPIRNLKNELYELFGRR